MKKTNIYIFLYISVQQWIGEERRNFNIRQFVDEFIYKSEEG